MAFNLNGTTENNSATDRANSNWKKSQGFINIFVPNVGGGRRKLGSIGLKADKPAEAKLLAFLEEDPSRIGLLMARAEFDYQSAEGSEDSGFDLNFGVDESAEADALEQHLAAEAQG
jgi:hypothetical protein